MKKNLVLLVAVGSAVLPAITRADIPAAKSKTTKPDPKRMYYYISKEARTGSNIPMVQRVYGGYVDNAANPAVYGATQIQRTGALDAGTALYKLDPSITLRGGR